MGFPDNRRLANWTFRPPDGKRTGLSVCPSPDQGRAFGRDYAWPDLGALRAR